MLLGLEKLGISKLNIVNSSDIAEKIDFQENLFSVINSGKNEQEDLYFYEKIEFIHPVLSVGILENLNLYNNLNFHILGKINIYEILDFLEILQSDINSIKNITENLDFLLNLQANIHSSKNIIENLNFQEYLKRKNKLFINIKETNISLREYLNAQITGSNLDINSFSFNKAIPSNKILYINSNTYNVLLDNQNNIDKYSGEWIKISPETIKINVQPQNNNMEIWIEFQELFL